MNSLNDHSLHVRPKTRLPDTVDGSSSNSDPRSDGAVESARQQGRESLGIGIVYLVGAGPGDVELLTLKAHRLIRSADAIVYDHLVAPEILALAGSDVERVFVGKKGGGFCCPQRDIEGTLIR